MSLDKFIYLCIYQHNQLHCKEKQLGFQFKMASEHKYLLGIASESSRVRGKSKKEE